jgi:hypothetical protein
MKDFTVEVFKAIDLLRVQRSTKIQHLELSKSQNDEIINRMTTVGFATGGDGKLVKLMGGYPVRVNPAQAENIVKIVYSVVGMPFTKVVYLDEQSTI